MARTIWRMKVHPGAGHVTSVEKPLQAPRVVAVDYDSSGDVSVWFEHGADDGTTDVYNLELTAVPTGGAIPDGFEYAGSATNIVAGRPLHVYGRTFRV